MNAIFVMSDSTFPARVNWCYCTSVCNNISLF
jgi:hypothetical protein